MTPERRRRWAPALLLGLLALPCAAENAVLIPLPIAQATGRTWDSRDNQTLSGVLVGFLLPATGPVTALAPLVAELSADGGLGRTQAGSWAGSAPAKTQRVEKSGYAVAGLRILVTHDGAAVRTRQVQVLWKAWSAGQLSGPVVEGPVYGSPAADRDATKIVELRLTSNLGALGVYALVDGATLAEFSLIQRPQPAAASSAPAQVAPGGPQAPTVPVVPGVPPVTLKR